jgi:hypothetical protein
LAKARPEAMFEWYGVSLPKLEERRLAERVGLTAAC